MSKRAHSDVDLCEIEGIIKRHLMADATCHTNSEISSNPNSNQATPHGDDSDDDLICIGEVNEPEETEDMENAGHHTDDKFNVKQPNGRVLGFYFLKNILKCF